MNRTGVVRLRVFYGGAHTGPESDGYPEAWYLPAANDIPTGYATVGSRFDQFDPTNTQAGSAVFQYPNDQPAAALWYHDHTLGMTRSNVYAGPAGFYLLRGGPTDAKSGVLPGPAPALGDAPGTRYYEIPLAIQDRSFGDDGSLWYPAHRAFFEGLEPGQLQIPFTPELACHPEGGHGGMGALAGEHDTMSDIAPIWNPEFFGNTMLVNGKTWPVLTVEPRRYRFRMLNGCNSRFIVLKLTDTPDGQLGPAALPFWQIGAEQSFLPAPVQLDTLLMGPAERADVIVDFTGLPAGTELFLVNEGPDEPFGGGIPGVDFPVADPASTGQVMKFVIGPLLGTDTSTPPAALKLPAIPKLGPPDVVRPLALIEEDSKTVRVVEQDGNIVLDCEEGEPFGPASAVSGTIGADGMATPLKWMDAPTDNPTLNTTEVWEFYNFTMDAHPIHIHLVKFEVVDRQPLMLDEEGMAMQPVMLDGAARPPELWESGYKDTVIAYPGEVTRVKAFFDIAGLYVWHCHIVEHEDNEMMRPFMVLP